MEPRISQNTTNDPASPTGLTITVLGASASCADAGDACSGYLVRQGDTSLLLDCGPGVIGNLRQVIAFNRITAIIITHFHPDHFLDLIPMRYGLRYDVRTTGTTAAPPVRPRLFVPPGGAAYLAGIGESLRRNPRFFADAFRLEEYDPDTTLDIDGILVAFQRTTHDEPTWALALTGHTGARLVYTADTKESRAVEQFAADADLLLCESTYPANLGEHTDGSGHHLSSRQAGELARRANARRLMLTHFWPGIPRLQFLDDAERAFRAPVILARPGLTESVTPGSPPVLAVESPLRREI